METPPRAWGRRRAIFGSKIHFGNTPTCMGKTPLIPLMTFSSKKHPHVHGEDDNTFNILL